MDSDQQQVEVRARDLLRASGQHAPPYSARRVIARLYPQVQVMGAMLPRHVDEVTTWFDPDVPAILYRQTMSKVDQRFAIAHGLGHVLIDGRPTDQTSCRPGQPFDYRRERRADMFAIALLVPIPNVCRCIWTWDRSHGQTMTSQWGGGVNAISSMARHFGVPPWVVMRRVRQARTDSSFRPEKMARTG